MHTIDNGLLKVSFFLVLRVGYEKPEHWKYITASLKLSSQAVYAAAVSDAFRVFRLCQPVEYNRQPRDPFQAAAHYKCAETRLAALHFLPALFQIPRVNEHLDSEVTENFMNLVVFARLVGHFSFKPLTEVCINISSLSHLIVGSSSDRIDNKRRRFLFQELLNLAQSHLILHLQYYIDKGHFHVFTPLTHFALHIIEDLIRFGCAAGHISAYAFENQLSIFGKVH